jgi:CBS domain-containing protein
MDSKKIKDVMTTNCVTVSADDHVFDVALKMKKHNIGFMPVVQDHKILGVITDRDLVIRGYAEKRSGSESVREVMTTKLFTVKEDTSIDEAAQIMADQQIRRLPVVEQDELRGVIAIGDLAVRVKYKDEAGQALSQISQPQDTVRMT